MNDKPQATSTVVVPVTGQAESPDGVKISVAGNFTFNLTQLDPAPTPTPAPIPVPGPGISIDRVTDAAGATITSAVGGSVVYIRGSGMGAGGVASIAGKPLTVQEWEPWMVVCRLPVVPVTVTGTVLVVPTAAPQGVSKFMFTITG